MDDLGSLMGAPKRIMLGAASYVVSPLTIGDLGKFQEWIDWQTDPFRLVQEAIERGDYTIAQQKYMFEAATNAARKRVLLGMPEADALMTSMDGVLRLLTISIGKADPSFTEARARVLYDKMSMGDIRMLMESTGAALVMSDPKAATGGQTTEA